MKESSSSIIKLNDLKKFIISNVNLQIRQKAAARLYITGAPGCGKSDLMRQVCQENGWALAVRYISNVAIEQITGIPTMPKAGEEAAWSRPEIFNFSSLEYKPKGYEMGKTPTVLLLDDFHLCDRMMQKYMFQLLTYMGLNGYSLPGKTAIILAGNRANDKAIAMPIPAPVCNRMMFVETGADAEDWLKNFAFKNEVRGDICTFIHERGTSVLVKEPIESNAWASPRSWTYLSYQMDQFESCFGKIDINDLRTIATGLLGSEITKDFIMYRELFAKWNYNDFLEMDWKDCREMLTESVQKSPTEAYAIINAGSAWLISKYRDANCDKNNPAVKEAVKLYYRILTLMMITKTQRVNIKPLVVSGIKYLKTYQDEAEVKRLKVDGKVALVDMLIDEVTQKRDIDYVFYQMLADMWNYKLPDTVKEKVRAAEERIAKSATVEL